jgi:hypothetical protein
MEAAFEIIGKLENPFGMRFLAGNSHLVDATRRGGAFLDKRDEG